MKTYLRILRYALPLGSFLPTYLFFTLLTVVFGILNFTILKPLLDVLFSNEATVKTLSPPAIELNPQYLIKYFDYLIADQMQTGGQRAALYMVCGFFAASIVFSNIGRYFSTVMIEGLRARVVNRLREHVFSRLTRLHLGYFNNERKGELISYLTTDVQEIENSVGSSTAVMIKEPMTLILMIWVLITLSWKLTLFAVLVLPLSAFVISTLVKRLKRNAGETQQSLSRILTVLDEALGGMRIINAFNAIGYINRRFQKENTEYSRLMVTMARRRELAPSISEIFGSFVVVVILLMGGSLVLGPDAEMSASAFSTYLLLFSQVLRPAKEIVTTIGNVQRGLASAERVFGMLDLEPQIKDKPNAQTIDRLTKGVEFRNVSFSYGDRKVLDNVSFTIPVGKTVALVGQSGGGKSTIADLLPRFYDVAEGAILVDGIDVRDLTQQSLRNLMGIVTQESTLFNDSVYNNIAFGDEAAPMADVQRAAEVAHAAEFVNKLAQGYQTEIGDRGGRLSGGQRQRLSIARAVYKNPDILILDEATSALDTESEKLVQEALSHLMKDRTALVIAHRLSTIMDADIILVVQNGKIVERGTHQELLDMGDGLYRKLSQLQAM